MVNREARKAYIETKGPLRVLHVNKLYHPWIGGVERAVQDLAEGLSENYGADVTVLCCHVGARSTTERINGVTVRRCASVGMLYGMPLSLTFLGSLRGVVQNQDIIHLHMPFPLAALVAPLVLRNFDAGRIIVHYHSDVIRQKRVAWMYTPFLTRLLGRADRIIVTSPNLLQSPYVQRFSRKAVVLPLAIDLNKHKRPTAAITAKVRKLLRIRDDEKVVLFVGRFVYYKGLEYLIDAMQDVDARCVLVGSGPLERTLRRRVETNGLAEKVQFVGNRTDDELRAYYALADVFVLPSIQPTEAFGIVQLEAMAYGVPIVNTALPTGVPWVSVHGETGVTVTPGDSKALADAMNAILEKDDLALRFSRNARKRVEKFDLKHVVGKVYDLYREVLGDGNS